jgi:hypothetical protein
MKYTFIRLSRSWYGPVNLLDRSDGLLDDIHVGVEDLETHRLAEFTFGAYDFRKNSKRVYDAAIQIHAFDDSWWAFTNAHVLDVLMEISLLKSRTLDDIEPVLIAAGFVDVTPTKRLA